MKSLKCQIHRAIYRFFLLRRLICNLTSKPCGKETNLLNLEDIFVADNFLSRRKFFVSFSVSENKTQGKEMGKEPSLCGNMQEVL